MPLLPKLSILQSRLVATVVASIMIILLYFAFSFPQFAYAIDVDSIRGEDHNHDRLLDSPIFDYDFDRELDFGGVEYEAEFIGVDRGIIGERATNTPSALINNRMDLTNIEQGSLVSYMFTNASLWASKAPATPGLPSQATLQRSVENPEDVSVEEDGELERRQTSSGKYRTLYITVTACSQPTSNTSTTPAPQLMLYVSQSENNTTPGPSESSTLQDSVMLEEGYALYEVNATGNVYIGVYGYERSGYTGVWSAQIAASIDAPYHYFRNVSDPNLFLVDSDHAAALLFTNSLLANASNTTLVEEWMNGTPPYVLFASDATDNAIMGLQYSYCGLQTNAQIAASRPGQTVSNIKTGMTAIGAGTLPKQQFYIDGLSAGTNYNVVLAMNGNSTNSGDGVVGGGGQVFPMTSFETLTSDNCQVMYDLAFCDQVAYSVPANNNNFPNISALASWYDNTTQGLYQFFDNALAQIPCETTASAKYSLARTCDDCSAAYKTWLCSVMIPRCTDFSSSADYLQSRALGQPFPNGTFIDSDTRSFYNNSAAYNGSRNLMIDQSIQPGPYKEILPCAELCYDIVQSCPAAMNFGCPQPGNIGFNESYAMKPKTPIFNANGQQINLTCNYPGATHGYNAGSQVLPSRLPVLAVMLVGLLFI